MKKTLVDICAAEWKIVEVKRATLQKKYGSSEDELDGFTDYDNQTIYLNSDLHAHRKAVCLVHEWMHVIVDYVGAPWNDAGEKEIRMLEHHIYNLIHTFPEEYKE